MQKAVRRITFRCGEVFPSSRPLSHWIITMARIHNDLNVSSDLLLRCYQQPEIPRTSKWVYFGTLFASHLREAIKFLIDTKSHPEVAAFISNLSQEARNQCEFVCRQGEPFCDSFVKKALAPIRNTVFHYPDLTMKGLQLMRPALDDLAAMGAMVEVFSSEHGYDLRFEFADHIVNHMTFGRHFTDSDESVSFFTKLQELSSSFLRLAYSSVTTYLRDYAPLSDVVLELQEYSYAVDRTTTENPRS